MTSIKIRLSSPLEANVFDTVARNWAESVFISGCKKSKDGNLILKNGRPTQEKNSSTQLRKFYNELVMWHDKVYSASGRDNRELEFKMQAPFIKMLNAKVAYACGRKPQLVDENFVTMFSDCINQIDSADTLRHAKLFMEAFMGFYKAQEK